MEYNCLCDVVNSVAPLFVLNDVNLSTCITRCDANAHCGGINYNRYRTCYLLDHTPHPRPDYMKHATISCSKRDAYRATHPSKRCHPSDYTFDWKKRLCDASPAAHPVGLSGTTKTMNLSDLAVLVTHGQRIGNFNALDWYGASVYRSYDKLDDCINVSKKENVAKHFFHEGGKKWFARLVGNKEWWCANRNFFLHVNRLYEMYPSKSFYLFIDDDTVVFTEQLRKLLHIIRGMNRVFMGHVMSPLSRLMDTMIASGGGVLLSHDVMDRMNSSGLIDAVFDERTSRYAWYPMDWVLSDVIIHRMGIKPRGHPGFQQFANEPWGCDCPRHAVTCHPYKTPKAQLQVLQSMTDELDDVQLTPCEKPDVSLSILKSSCDHTKA